MSVPAITVLLPVYNAAAFICEAIDSVLAQTFDDFELLIINDGSTDATDAIITSYTDSRIVYIKNDKNIGLVATLNKGIDLAQGQYLARMDADDICDKNRLKQQFNLLENKPTVAVVGCNISFINTAGNITGEWKEDINTITHQQIFKKIIWGNCVAHPSIMARTAILMDGQHNFPRLFF